MKKDSVIEIRIGRSALVILALLLTLAAVAVTMPGYLQAQKAQESFKDKFKVASETGGIGVAVSADGKYVYVAGPSGILVSDDFGKTGSWVQTAVMK
jgi:hypothetical protein